MRSALRHLVVAALLCVGLSSFAVAQGVGAIGGTIMDESGAVLPGATVTLSAPGIIGGNQDTVTDGQGAYEFTRLVSGVYSVRAELTGFRTAIQPNIRVNADTTSRADLKLSIGEMAEQMTVTGAAPLLDTTSALNQTVMTRDVIDALPGRNDIYSIGRMATGVSLNKYDVGGASPLQSNAFVHGSLGYENDYMVDGMDVSNPCCAGGGSSAGRFDPFLYQELNYQTGNAPAQYHTGGVVYNMITKTGTNQFRGTAMFSGGNKAMGADNISDDFRARLLAAVPARILAVRPDLKPNADIKNIYDTAATFSGPIVKDRLWFVVGGKYNFFDQNLLGSYGLNGEYTPNDSKGINYSGKISWQSSQSSQVHYLQNYNSSQQLHRHSYGTDFIGAEVTAKNNAQTYLEQGRFTKVLSSRMVMDVQGSVQKSGTGGPPQDGVENGDIAVFDSVLRSHSVAAETYVDQPNVRVNITGSLTYSGGNHDVKVGYWFNRGFYNNTAYSLSNYPAGLRIVLRNGVLDSVNTYNTPNSYDQYTLARDIYAQDKWTPVRKLTLNLGVRYQTDKGWQPATCQVETIFIAGQCFAAIDDTPNWKGVAPRFSAVYDVTGTGTTALKFSANRYLPVPGTPYVNVVNPIKSANDTRAWTVCAAGQTSACDLNRDNIPQLNELGPSTGFNLGTTNRYDPDVEWPYVNEMAAEIEQQIGSGVVVSASYHYRGLRNQIAPTNFAVPTSGYIPLQVVERTSGREVTVYNQDPATRGKFDVVYNNSPVLDASFNGLDLEVNKRMSDHWMVMVGLTHGKTEGDIYATVNGTGGDLNNPNLQFRRGPYGDDTPTIFKSSGAYQFPYGISLSGSFQHYAGIPELTTVQVAANTVALTQVTQTLTVEPRGTTRLPSVNAMDLGLRKTFTFGTRRFEPILDIYNVLNAGPATSRTTLLGPSYGQVSAIMRGRLLKVGVNVDF